MSATAKLEISMSKLPRLERCPASGVLPQVRHIQSEHGTKVSPSTRGTIIHQFLCDVSLVGREAALEKLEEDERELVRWIDLGKLPAVKPESYAVEVGLAWNWETGEGRELFRGSGARDYRDLAVTEIAGTADVIGLTEDAVVVIDYKTGWRYLGPAAESLQLVGYALAACGAFGKSKAIVEFRRITPEGDSFPIRAELDAMDLDVAAERIRDIIAGITEAGYEYLSEGGAANLELVEGDHCHYCPSFGVCPAKMTLARSLTSSSAESKLTVDNFPKVYERLQLAKDVLKKVEESLKDFARAEPIPLGDGFVFGVKPYNTETIDPVTGAVVIATQFGQATADAAVREVKTLTKENLKAALRAVWLPKNPGAKITKIDEVALEAIRTAKAVSVETTYPVMRFKPKVEKEREPA